MYKQVLMSVMGYKISMSHFTFLTQTVVRPARVYIWEYIHVACNNIALSQALQFQVKGQHTLGRWKKAPNFLMYYHGNLINPVILEVYSNLTKQYTHTHMYFSGKLILYGVY